MSKAKDKRIKKLKKIRIWPSVLGLFLLSLIFAILVSIVVAIAGLEIIQRKIMVCSERSAQMAALYQEYDETSVQNIDVAVRTYLQFDDEMEVVGAVAENGVVHWVGETSVPKKDSALDISLMYGDEIVEAKVIVEEDSQGLLTVEDDTLVVGDDFIGALNFENLEKGEDLFSSDAEDAVLEFKIWYVIPVDNLEVYILNSIYVFAHDLLFMIVCLGTVGILIAVFVIYYLISFISVIFTVRKTSKIIYTDVVTGGNNWLHFEKRGNALLKHKWSEKNKYAMVHLNMRKYRSFCTCFGAQVGEELIEKLYWILKKQIKRNEVMAHHENAEFGLLLAYGSKEALIKRIEEMESALNTAMPNMKIYFGVGVYEIGEEERDINQLYINAMVACEKLGEEADNQIAFFDIEMSKEKLWERKVEDDMERALAGKEFQVYLQPKISTLEEQLAGAEALVRWIHPTEGFIPPNKFIPIFEKNGFILKLDDYMLEEVARQQAEWIAQGRRIVPISVNVSRAHFTREDLTEHICSIVDKYNIPHNVIELELTESAFFDDKKVLINTVKKLRDAGFIVSMDDFGAGYSSLNSLKELHIDVLKIDADFFRGAEFEERGVWIVTKVIDLAKKLNMKIVAEGIESREQVDFLIDQKCDLIQGYFFAKPMPINEFVEKYNA